MSTITSLPTPIRTYVSDFVALRRRHAAVRALGRAAALTAGWVLLCTLIDRLSHLPGWVRLVLLAVNVAIVVVLVARPLWAWLTRDVDWREATADIERRDGRLGERLQTVASQWLAPANHRGSPQLVERLTGEVASSLRDDPPARLLPKAPAVRPWGLAAALVAVIGGLCLVPALGMRTLLARYAMPLADIAAPTTTRLFVEPGDVQVIEGESVKVRVAADRLGDGRTVTLHYAKAGTAPATLVMPAANVAPVATTTTAATQPAVATTQPSGRQHFEATLGPVDQDIRYHASGGDATSPAYTVRVLRKPAVAEFRIRYAYPAYTKRDPFTVANTDGLVEAPVGSEATITVVSTEPLSSARLKLASGRTIVMSSGARPSEFEARLMVETDDAYTIELASAHEIPGTGPGTSVIRAIPDRPPLVQLLQPATELRLHPRDILTLPFQAMDDYGVGTLATRLEVTAAGADRAGAVNLALKRPTTQSSTVLDGAPERAVDGNTDGNFVANKSVTHTQHEPHAWWEVDLGETKPISVIELWNRTDCCPERLSDFTVFVSEQPFVAKDISQTQQQPGVRALRTPGVGGTPTSLDVYQPGRYVRVQLNKADILSLAEVKVFEEKPPAAAAAPASAGNKTTASSDSPIPIRGDPRQQAGDVRVDLATLNVHVGDVVAVTLVATDTAGQEARSETFRVVVSPRSIDMATYERIFELARAAEQADAMAKELEGARGQFDAARQRASDRNNPSWQAQTQLSRHFATAAEAAEAVRSALMRAVVRTSGPELSVALVDLVDATEHAATLAEDVNAQFGYGETPDDRDRGLLDRALERARQAREQLKALADGESAAAVLADLDNLKVSSQTVPLDRAGAAAQRQRTQRLKDDVAAAAKQLGLDSNGADLEGQLRGKVDHARGLAKSKGMQNYQDEARAFMGDLKERSRRQLALDERMGATAQAEAVRPDADLVRARDLHLATAAAQRLQALAAARRFPEQGSPDDPRDAFPKAIGAVHREHELNRRANVNPDELAKVRPAAAEARKQLEAWAAVPTPQVDEPYAGADRDEQPDAYADLRELERLAMEANVDAVLRDYEEMARRDREIAERLAAARRNPPDAAEAWSQRFREQIERAIARARELDDLAKRQDALRGETEDAAKDGEAGKAEAPDLAEQQDELARAIERAAQAGQDQQGSSETSGENADGSPSFGENANDQPDSRLAAADAIQQAQSRLAAMPQQLTKTQRAAANQRDMKGRAQQARQAAEQAATDQKSAASRAADAAADQLREADTRLWETAKPVEPEVAKAMTEALKGFDPETLEAVAAIDRQLAPALTSLKRSAAAGDEGGVARAVDEARRAIDAVQAELKGAQEALMERDPLVAAKWFASTAAAELAKQPPDFRSATANQKNASAALDRAWNESVRQAAAARLAGIPSLAPAFVPGKVAGTSSAAPGTGEGQAQGPGTGSSAEDAFLREWGRLQWRQPDDLSVSAHESDPPGYQDALRAYFEALGKARQDAPQQEGGAKP